jgi:hypothetical protein
MHAACVAQHHCGCCAYIPLVAPTRHARVSRMETWVMGQLAWHPLTMCHCYHPHTLDKNKTDRSARLIGQIDRASPVSPSVCLRMARRIHETVFAFLTKSDLISKRCAARIISRSIRTKVTPFFCHKPLLSKKAVCHNKESSYTYVWLSLPCTFTNG